MIQAIWIITENGQCIFSHKYVTLDIDDQLISGLLTAFDAFSTESGIGGLQQIGGEDSQFIYGSTGKLLVASLADKDDNSSLVEKLMNKISKTFQEKYAKYLHDVTYVDLNTFNGFESDIDSILLPKVYRRGLFSTLFATIVTIGLTTGVLFLLLQFIQAQTAIFVIFLAFIPGLFIGSVIAGKGKYALISSIIGVLPIITLSVYLMVLDIIANPETLSNNVFTIVLMSEQYITIAILSAILGGGFIDRRRLSPLSKSKKSLQVFTAGSVVTTSDLGQDVFYQEEQYQEQYQTESQQSDDFYAQSSSLSQEQKNDWET
ncbi:MAG: hypothetical protein FK734_12125 [Asgard group archaeon]|nr:hypothetical protein [Asgard group archaeon]